MPKTYIAVALTLYTAACSTTSADTMLEADSEAGAALVASAEVRAAQVESVQAQAQVMADGAIAYMRSEQSFRRDQPWHRYKLFEIGGKHSGKDGLPVEWQDYVFPGGPSFTFSSHEEVPVAGAPSPTVGKEVIDDLLLATFFKLGYMLEDTSDLRVSYRTGPGEGAEATAVITVETDMDPNDPKNHTVTYELAIDGETLEVVATNPVVTHAMR